MKILIINKFLYPKGGDAMITLDTGKLLTRNGHEVEYWGMTHPANENFRFKDYFVRQVDFDKKAGALERLRISLNLLYSFEAKRKIIKLLKIWKPDVVHLHNFSHQISPSILHIFKKQNIQVVMTMHDYKLVCASYALLSKGKICEKCKSKKYCHCFLEKCVKNSRPKSLLNTIEMYLHHKFLRIYDLIDIFISPSKFLKGKVEEMGFKGKIFHLPNFIAMRQYTQKYDWDDNSIVYFGRLSKEKGLFTLIEAMKELPNVTLKIIGEGPIKEALGSRVETLGLKNIKFLGYKSGKELNDEIRKSMFVVLPSEWYENNPRTIIEGFALGKPAIGARIGGIPELVRDNETGFTFEPGNVDDLISKIKELIADPDLIQKMGHGARRLSEEEFNEEKHYKGLIQVYENAITKKEVLL